MYMCYSMLDRAHTHTPHSLPILILRAEVSYETAGRIPVHFYPPIVNLIYLDTAEIMRLS